MKLFLFIAALLLSMQCLAADCQKNKLWRVDDACLNIVVVETNTLLEKTTAKLLASADARRKELLSASNEAWTAYRKHQCLLAFDYSRAMHHEYGQVGTMAPSDNMRCLIRLNENRLMELREVETRS